LQEKFKHAKAFGITGNYNKERAGKFIDTVRAHVENPDVQQIIGTYRRQPVIHYYHPETHVNVMTSLDGEFYSGWELSKPQQDNLEQRGSL